MISLCSDWEFTREWSAGFAHGEGRFPLVDLPHTAGEVPLHYAKPEDYAGICGYRRGLSVPASASFCSLTARRILPRYI